MLACSESCEIEMKDGAMNLFDLMVVNYVLSGCSCPDECPFLSYYLTIDI